MIKPVIQAVLNAKALNKLATQLSGMDNAYVTVGVHEGAGQYPGGQSVVMVALANEFGTDKIPERSFLRSVVNENRDKINDWRKEGLKNILTNGWSVEKALEMIGTRLQILVQNKIKSNIPPPNAPATVARKRARGVAPRTLIDTTLLLRSVQYRVHVGK